MNDEFSPFFRDRESRLSALSPERQEKIKELASQQENPDAFVDEYIMSGYLSKKYGVPAKEIRADYESFSVGKRMSGDPAKDWDTISGEYAKWEQYKVKPEFREAPSYKRSVGGQTAVDDYLKMLPVGFEELAQSIPEGIASQIGSYSKAFAVGKGTAEVANPIEKYAGELRGIDEEIQRRAEGKNRTQRFQEWPDELLQSRRETLVTQMKEQTGLDPEQVRTIEDVREIANMDLDERIKDDRVNRFAETMLEKAEFWRELKEEAVTRWNVDPEIANSTAGQFIKSVGMAPGFVGLAALGPLGFGMMESSMYTWVEEEARVAAEERGEEFKPEEGMGVRTLSATGQALLERAFGFERVADDVIRAAGKGDINRKMRFIDFVKRVGRRAMASAVEEGMTEPTQGAWNDLIASITYDKGRELLSPDALKTRFLEAVAGFSLGLMMGGGMVAMEESDVRRGQKKHLKSRMGGPLTQEEFEMLGYYKTEAELREVAETPEAGELLVRAVKGNVEAQNQYNARMMVKSEKFTEEFSVGSMDENKSRFRVGEWEGRKVVINDKTGFQMLLNMENPLHKQLYEQLQSQKAFEGEIEELGRMGAYDETSYDQWRQEQESDRGKVEQQVLIPGRGGMAPMRSIPVPTILETGEGDQFGEFIVFVGEDEIGRFQSREEAQTASLDYMAKRDKEFDDATQNTLDFIMAFNEDVTFENDPAKWRNLRTKLEESARGRRFVKSLQLGKVQDQELFDQIRSVLGVSPEEVTMQNLENAVITGESIEEFRRNIYRDTIRISKGATPLTIYEEISETYLKQRIRMGDLSWDDILRWKTEFEEKTGIIEYTIEDWMNEQEKERQLIEWWSNRGMDRVTGEALDEESEIELPRGVRGFFQKMRMYMSHLLRRARLFMELRAEGFFDEVFLWHLDRAVGLDADYVEQKINEAEERRANVAAGRVPGNELLRVIHRLGGLPTPSSQGAMNDPLRAELKDLFDNWPQKGVPHARIRMWRKNPEGLDRLAEALREEGFAVETPIQLLDLIEASLRGEETYPEREGEWEAPTFQIQRAEEFEQEAFDFAKKAKASLSSVFVSGVDRPEIAQGLVDANKNIGTQYSDINRLKQDLIETNKKGINIFVDSGAFPAFTAMLKGKRKSAVMDFDKVFARYDDLLEGIENPELVSLVMPDVIGDQEQTIALQKKYVGKIKSYMEKGIDVLIPIQKGEKEPAQVFKDLVEMLGSDNFRVSFPSNQAAFSALDLENFLKEVTPKKIHLLGIARKILPGGKSQGLLEIVGENAPEADVSADANMFRSIIGEIRADMGEDGLRGAVRRRFEKETTFQIDKAYMDAVEENNEATLREMVTNAARNWHPDAVFVPDAEMDIPLPDTANDLWKLKLERTRLEDTISRFGTDQKIIDDARRQWNRWQDIQSMPDLTTQDKEDMAFEEGLGFVQMRYETLDEFTQAELKYKEDSIQELRDVEEAILEYQGYLDAIKTGQPFTAYVYHGTRVGDLEGDRFDPGHLGRNTKAGSAQLGYFFAATKDTSNAYIRGIIAVPQRWFVMLDPNDMGRFTRSLYAYWSDMMRDRREEWALENINEEVDNPAWWDQDYEEWLDETAENNPAFLQDYAEEIGIKLPNRDTRPASPKVHELYIHMKNPLVVNQGGEYYREETYRSVMQQARDAGHDGVVWLATRDGGPIDNVFAVLKGNEKQIKSAEPVTYDNGEVVPISKRFDLADGRITYQIGNVWTTPQQEITSADTSINEKKMPASIKKIDWKPGTVNADIGGGRFDNVTDYLSRVGVKNYIYDPFNRDRAFNSRSVEAIRGGQADTATVNNVLNVIRETEARRQVILQAADAVGSNGTAYFIVYEGDGSGEGRETSKGWQENRKTRDYLEEIGEVFSDVWMSKGMIVAENPRVATYQISFWNQDLEQVQKASLEEVAGRVEAEAKQWHKDLGIDPSKMTDQQKIDFVTSVWIDEAATALGGDDSGKEWYNEDIRYMERTLKAMFPQLNKHEMVIAKAFIAYTSFGNTPSSNFFTTVRMLIAAGGDVTKVQPVQPDGKGWTQRKQAVVDGVNRIQKLIKDKGSVRKASEWLLSEHPIKELREYNKNIPGDQNDMLLGGMIQGEKGGPFFLNLNGIEQELTMDLWFSRSWNRVFGTLLLDKPVPKYGTGKKKNQIIGYEYTQDTPRNLAERDLMRRVVSAAASRLGLTVRDFQAVMWYYEQRLYSSYGKQSFSGSYKDAARKVLEQSGFNSPTSLENYRKAEKGGKDAQFEDIARDSIERVPKSRRINILPSLQVIRTNRPLSEVTGKKPEDLYEPDPDPPFLESADEIFNQIRIQQLEDIFDEPMVPVSEKIRRTTKQELGVSRVGANMMSPVASRLRRVDRRLGERLRDFEWDVRTTKSKYRMRVRGYMEKLAALPEQESIQLKIALSNGMTDIVQKIHRKYGMEDAYREVQDVLENIRERMLRAGFEVGKIDDYFPRKVVDYEALHRDLYGTEVYGPIEQLLAKAQEQAGRELDEQERGEVIASYLQGYLTAEDGKPGMTKSRTIEDIAKYHEHYANPADALAQHIDRAVDAFSKKKFFGKDGVWEEVVVDVGGQMEIDGGVTPPVIQRRFRKLNVERSIDKFVMAAMVKKRLSLAEQREIKDLLSAYFNYRISSRAIRGMKAATYITLMSNIGSTLTQFGDMAWSLYEGGMLNTISAAYNAVTYNSAYTREDLGLERIGQEFESMDGMMNAVTWMFDHTGLSLVDRIGKEALINATLKRMQQEARRGRLSARNQERLVAIFGGDADQVFNDLKEGKLTENIGRLLFSVLSDYQPVTNAEMPVWYLENPNGRILYTLKTFTIKMLDAFRREGFDEMAKGNVKRGIWQLMRLAALFYMANVPVDWIKDFIYGRQTRLTDVMVDNIFKLGGLSRFHLYYTREYGLSSGFMKIFMPPAPFAFLDPMFQDVQDYYDALSKGDDFSWQDMESIRLIPGVGKEIFWWAGKGKEKTEKRVEREIREGKR